MSAGGSDAGGSDAGGSDAGGSVAGGSDAGGSDAGSSGAVAVRRWSSMLITIRRYNKRRTVTSGRYAESQYKELTVFTTAVDASKT